MFNPIKSASQWGLAPKLNADYARMFIVKDSLCDGTKWHVRTVPANPATDPYFAIGQAALHLAVESGNIKVKGGFGGFGVAAGSPMPNVDRAIDGNTETLSIAHAAAAVSPSAASRQR